MALPRETSGTRTSQVLRATGWAPVSTGTEFMSRTEASTVDGGTVVPTVTPGTRLLAIAFSTRKR